MGEQQFRMVPYTRPHSFTFLTNRIHSDDRVEQIFSDKTYKYIYSLSDTSYTIPLVGRELYLAKFGRTCKQNFPPQNRSLYHGALFYHDRLTDENSLIYPISANTVCPTFAVRSCRNLVNLFSHPKKQPQHRLGKERPRRRRSGPKERSKTRRSTPSSLTSRLTTAS